MREVTMEGYEDRVLAFVDVLGWKNLLDESVCHAGVFHLIRSACSTMRLPSLLTGDHDVDAGAVHAAHFSDTFVLSAAPGDEAAIVFLLGYVRSLCSVLLKAGHYTRGAIVCGALFHEHDVIFGPALVEAHCLEKKEAKYPRILVTPAARPYLDVDQDTVVVADRDGRHFLDFLVALNDPDDLPLIREKVLEKIEREKDRTELKQKNDWMLAYIERHLYGGS
jgi:hypothetical protein